MATLSYNPTVALKSSLHEELVYIIQPRDESKEFELVSVNASSSLSASDLATNSISDTVPFAGDKGNSFTALISAQDEIYAFAGDCSKGANGAGLWTFNASQTSDNGEWKETDITVRGISGSDTIAGANYLASGMAFSGIVNGSTDLYVFGGLCPNSSTQTVDSWQASANYSNTMLALDAGSSSDESYNLKELYSRGPPIPEAGFSVTPLTPTFSNTSGGDMSRQQSFVLLGGQTQTAFINMSQAALFSLPQQSWAFLGIDDPGSKSNTDLAIRATTKTIDPRSGHTAVLSEDGSKIIVYGGWVGDVNTPANPQLAVLQVGDEYGGSGDWQWAIPNPLGTPPSGAGLYGHGAAMLPGNVLMITGGYTISESSSKMFKLFRRQNADSNTNTHFFNITSNSWTPNYNNPTPQSSKSNTSGGSSSGKKIGLGVGLGIGLLLLLAILLILILLWRRKHRSSRSINEKDLQGLSLGSQHVVSPALGYTNLRARSPDSYPWAPSGPINPQDLHRGAHEAERTGLLVEVPSPNRGLRRSLHSRPNYSYDDGRRSRASNSIHPIDERDEYEAVPDHDNGDLGHRGTPSPEHAPHDIVAAAPILDPFRDPESHPTDHDHAPERHLLDGSRTPSPVSPAHSPTHSRDQHSRNQHTHTRSLEMASWEQDWAAAAAVPAPLAFRAPSPAVRTPSPDKSDRTSSTLSNRSSASMVSALSYQPGDSHSVSALSFVSRSLSLREGGLGARVGGGVGAGGAGGLTAGGLGSGEGRQQGGPPSPGGGRAAMGESVGGAHDAQTPRTSFPRLQTEGQALLGGSPFEVLSPLGSHPTSPQSQPQSPQNIQYGIPQYGAQQYGNPQTQTQSYQSPGSPSKAPRPKTWGVFGSVRRALAAAGVPGSSSSSTAERSSFLMPSELRRKPVGADSGSGSGSGLPQRSASAGAASVLFRRQQGARDWGAEESLSGVSGHGIGGAGWRPDSVAGRSMAGRSSPGAASFQGSEDWDVEGAVESRVVQLMFTVPKEKLRVVNASPDGDGVSVVSVEGSIGVVSGVGSGTGSSSGDGSGSGSGGSEGGSKVGSLRRVEEVGEVEEEREREGKGKRGVEEEEEGVGSASGGLRERVERSLEGGDAGQESPSPESGVIRSGRPGSIRGRALGAVRERVEGWESLSREGSGAGKGKGRADN